MRLLPSLERLLFLVERDTYEPGSHTGGGASSSGCEILRGTGFQAELVQLQQAIGAALSLPCNIETLPYRPDARLHVVLIFRTRYYERCLAESLLLPYKPSEFENRDTVRKLPLQVIRQKEKREKTPPPKKKPQINNQSRVSEGRLLEG